MGLDQDLNQSSNACIATQSAATLRLNAYLGKSFCQKTLALLGSGALNRYQVQLFSFNQPFLK